MPFHDRHFVRCANLADQLSEPQPDFAAHHRLAVLRRPYQVQMDAKDCVRCGVGSPSYERI